MTNPICSTPGPPSSTGHRQLHKHKGCIAVYRHTNKSRGSTRDTAAAFPQALAHAVKERTHLDVGERHGARGNPGFVMLVGVTGCREEAALGLVAARVEAEVERDGAARLGAAADVVELEPHERLDQRALAVRLVADDHDSRRQRHRCAAQLGRQRLQPVVRLVEELPRLPRVRLRRDRRRHWGQWRGWRSGAGFKSSTARAAARYLFQLDCLTNEILSASLHFILHFPSLFSFEQTTETFLVPPDSLYALWA